jgi:hypothetical protein
LFKKNILKINVEFLINNKLINIFFYNK